MSQSTVTAVAKVMDTVEILELILSNIPSPFELLRLRTVSQGFRNTIEDSVKLKRKEDLSITTKHWVLAGGGMEAHEAGGEWDEAPLRFVYNPLLFTIDSTETASFQDLMHRKMGFTETLLVKVPVPGQADQNQALTRLNKMFIAQPSIKSVMLLLNCHLPSFKSPPTVRLLVKNEGGVKIEDIVSAIQNEPAAAIMVEPAHCTGEDGSRIWFVTEAARLKVEGEESILRRMEKSAVRDLPMRCIHKDE